MRMMRRSGSSVLAVAALALTSTTTPALADVKAGVDAWGRGEYAAAIAQWRAPALKGDADAQFNMGQAYKLGRGVPMDLTVALDWYGKAAKQGHLQARDNLGLVLFQQDKRTEALPYLQESADRGEPRAQYIVGTAHFNGDLLAKDWVRAYALMTRASASGITQASRSLGQMDKYLSADQKRDGLALAQQLEKRATSQRSLALAGLPITTEAARPVVKPAVVPPSQPAAKPRPAPVEKPPVVASRVTPSIPGYVPSVPSPTDRVPAPDAPNPVPVKVAPVEAAPSVAGDWRIQLGAFGDEAKARTLWTSLEARVPALRALQPYLVKAGSVTRLQGGPLASKAAAEATCKAVAPTGNACFAVKH